MQFIPKAKSRRWSKKRLETQLFPPELKEKWKAIFTGFSVEITDSENSIRCLYENGGFGKGSHSRSFPLSCVESTSRINETKHAEILVLDLEETFFLAFFLNRVELLDINNTPINREQAFQRFKNVKPNFPYSLPAYLYLKSKGWVVKSGSKFGGDFLLYKRGTRFYHASFIVLVLSEERNFESKDLQGLHRVAETSDKDVLQLNVIAPQDVPIEDYHHFIHAFKVTETIPRRFDFKKPCSK